MANEWQTVVSASEDDGGWNTVVPKKVVAAPKEEPSAWETYAPEPIKNAVGGIESAARMVPNVVAGSVAQGMGTLGSLAGGNSMDTALQRGRERQEQFSIPAMTKAGATADEALGQGYDYVKRDVVAEGLLALDKKEWNDLGLSPEKQADLEASHRTAYEAGFDAVMFGSLVKQGMSIPKAMRESKVAFQERAKQAEKYQKEQAISNDGWTTLVKGQEEVVRERSMQDMDAQRRDEGNIPDQNIKSPYEIEPTEKAKLEAELNPADEAQGELFPREGTTPADTNIGPSLGEAGRGRDALIPPEKELGATVHTADVIDGASQLQGEFKYQDGIEYKEHIPAAEAARRIAESRADPTIIESRAENYYKAMEEAFNRGDKEAGLKYGAEGDRLTRLAQDLREGRRDTEPPQQQGKASDSPAELQQRQLAEQKARQAAYGNPIKTASRRTPAQLQQAQALGRRQRGIIDPDLLTLGTGKIWETLRDNYDTRKEAVTALMRKFKGTFSETVINHAIERANNPHSRETIVLMSPDDFHRMAVKRDEWYRTHPEQDARRESIREGLHSLRGLEDIPYLNVRITNRDGQPHAQAIAHEGRHRMDVFKEQGLDLIPVRIKANDGALAPRLMEGRWGQMKRLPELLHSEETGYKGNPGESIPFPESLTFPDGRESSNQSITIRPQQVQQQQGNPRVPLRQRGAIGDWSKRVAKSSQDVVAATLEAKKALEREKRLPDKVVSEEKFTPDAVKDIVSGGNGFLDRLMRDIQKLGLRLHVDRAVEILSRDSGPAGKIIKSVVDNIGEIERNKEISARDAIQETLGSKKGEGWRIGRSGRSDLRQMLDVWMENVGKDPLTREHFGNDRQWEIFKQSRDGLNKMIDRVNQARASLGKKAIPYLENYLPAIWQGDYRVTIRDAMNNKVGTYAFTNMIQASKAKKIFQKEHPNLLVEDPMHVEKMNDYHDFTAFEEAMEVNAGDFQATKELQKTYTRLLKQKGFGPHGMFRQGVEGFMGSERGEAGISNMEKAIEIYLKRGENHIANIEKVKVQMSLEKIPQEIKDKMPVAMQYLTDYLNQARGIDASMLKIIDSTFEHIGETTGFGRSAFERTTKNISGVASLYFLLRAPFLASQVFQHMNIIAKMRQNAIRMPEAFGATESYMMGMKNVISPDATFKQAMAWAEKNEYMNSTIVDLIKTRMSDPNSKRLGVIADGGRLILSHAEKAVVRSVAFAMTEYQLRKAVPNDLARFKQAADLMDHYMVHYDRVSSPLIYNDMGTLGETARPLKQYSHNTWGQFFEYAQAAKNKAEITPLALFMGNQALVAGLRGAILVGEATVIINLLNQMFNQDIPTPEQYLIKKGMPDWSIFGVPSAVTGFDISSSVSAPQLPQMLSLVPVSFAGNAALELATWATKAIQGRVTDKDTMELLLATTPSAMKGYWEEYFSRPGQPVPHPGMNMQGTHVRTDTEKKMAIWLGTKSVNEARHDADARVFKQLFARDAKQRLDGIDIIIDRIQNGQGVEPEILQYYISNGGDIRKLPQLIKERLIGQATPFNDKPFQGSMSLQKLHKLEMMKDELNREIGARGGSGGGGGAGDYMEQMATSGNDTDGQSPFKQERRPNKSFEEWYSTQSDNDKKEIRQHLKDRGIILPSETRGSTTKQFIPNEWQRPKGMRGI